MSSALLGNIVGRDDGFRLRGCYPLWHPFPRASTTRVLCNSLEEVQLPLTRPTTPRQQRPHAIALPRFRLTPVRSPLLRGSRLLSLPPGTEMFQIPGSTLGWQLPEAYRSLPRPSSASGAKASTVCPL